MFDTILHPLSNEHSPRQVHAYLLQGKQRQRITKADKNYLLFFNYNVQQETDQTK